MKFLAVVTPPYIYQVVSILTRLLLVKIISPAPSSRGTLYQGYLTGLRALQGPLHGGSWVGKDGGGKTGGTWEAVTGTGGGSRWSSGTGRNM